LRVQLVKERERECVVLILPRGRGFVRENAGKRSSSTLMCYIIHLQKYNFVLCARFFTSAKASALLAATQFSQGTRLLFSPRCSPYSAASFHSSNFSPRLIREVRKTSLSPSTTTKSLGDKSNTRFCADLVLF